MQNKSSLAILLFSILIVFSGCSNPDDSDEHNNSSVQITVSAAISLTDALEDIKTQYEADHDVSVNFNFGSSGKLAQQIEQGAPSDLFFSANQEWMDTLEDEKVIDTGIRSDITENNLVVIAQQDSSIELSAISDIEPSELDKTAVGNPDSVPAGKYTKQALKHVDMWDSIQDQVVLAKDVRQVLTYVESGNTDIGFVYGSDARISDQVKVVTKVGDKTHDPIIYPAAVVNDSEEKNAAKNFLDYLTTDDAQTIFEKYGFRS